MTSLEVLKSLDCVNLTPAQVGAVLGIDPNTLRWQAREDASKLGFPVIVVKSRTYIPRLPFLAFIAGERLQ